MNVNVIEKELYQNGLNYADKLSRGNRQFDFMDENIKWMNPAKMNRPIGSNQDEETTHQPENTKQTVEKHQPALRQNQMHMIRDEKDGQRPIQPPIDESKSPSIHPRPIDTTQPQCTEAPPPPLSRNSPTHQSYQVSESFVGIEPHQLSQISQPIEDYQVAEIFQTNNKQDAEILDSNIKDGIANGILNDHERKEREREMKKKFQYYRIKLKKQTELYLSRLNGCDHRGSRILHFHQDKDVCTTSCGFAIIPGTKNIPSGFLFFKKLKPCIHRFRAPPNLASLLRSRRSNLYPSDSPGGTPTRSPCQSSPPSPSLPSSSPPGCSSASQDVTLIPLREISKELRAPECTCSCPACSYTDLCIYQKQKKEVAPSPLFLNKIRTDNKIFSQDSTASSINSSPFNQHSPYEPWLEPMNWETLRTDQEPRLQRTQRWRPSAKARPSLNSLCRFGASCMNKNCRFRHEWNNLPSILRTEPDRRMVQPAELYNLPSRSVSHSELQNLPLKKSSLRADAQAWEPIRRPIRRNDSYDNDRIR